jgi:hypothetical protein
MNNLNELNPELEEFLKKELLEEKFLNLKKRKNFLLDALSSLKIEIEQLQNTFDNEQITNTEYMNWSIFLNNKTDSIKQELEDCLKELVLHDNKETTLEIFNKNINSGDNYDSYFDNDYY